MKKPEIFGSEVMARTLVAFALSLTRARKSNPRALFKWNSFSGRKFASEGKGPAMDDEKRGNP